jgi:hypothetical protein
MKTLLILPFIFLLSACDFGQSEDERLVAEREAHATLVLDQSMIAYEINADLLESEIIFGSLCQMHLEDTGHMDDEICDAYTEARQIAENASQAGIVLLMELFKLGILTMEHPRYPEFEAMIEHLISLSEEVYDIDKEIHNTTGAGCIKCSM